MLSYTSLCTVNIATVYKGSTLYTRSTVRGGLIRQNTISLAIRPCLDRFQYYWGCFWAANELIHERIMAKLKRLAKHGSKNRMATLANNFDIFQTAEDWLLDKDLQLHYKASYIDYLVII